jgi:hypothetical protein
VVCRVFNFIERNRDAIVRWVFNFVEKNRDAAGSIRWSAKEVKEVLALAAALDQICVRG